jgi:TonB family protein
MFLERNSTPARTSGWFARGFLAAVAFVFITQAGLIFILGARREPVPRRSTAPPVMAFVNRSAGTLLSLTDPTLFALPHFESFSGQGWMKTVPLKMPALDWSEPPHFLGLKTLELGAWPGAGNVEALSPSPADSSVTGPELTRASIEETSLLREASRVHLAGGLASRPLQTELKLRAWATNDLLGQTVLRVVVNRLGEPVSLAVLASCGYADADQFAREIVRTARFAPLPETAATIRAERGGPLTWGEMIFDWQALPVTNGPGALAP